MRDWSRPLIHITSLTWRFSARTLTFSTITTPLARSTLLTTWMVGAGAVVGLGESCAPTARATTLQTIPSMASSSLHDRQPRFLRDERPLARRETDLDLSQDTLAADIGDLAGAVNIVDDGEADRVQIGRA